MHAGLPLCLKCMRDFLFADDAAIVAHSAEDLQQLINPVSYTHLTLPTKA